MLKIGLAVSKGHAVAHAGAAAAHAAATVASDLARRKVQKEAMTVLCKTAASALIDKMMEEFEEASCGKHGNVDAQKKQYNAVVKKNYEDGLLTEEELKEQNKQLKEIGFESVATLLMAVDIVLETMGVEGAKEVVEAVDTIVEFIQNMDAAASQDGIPKDVSALIRTKLLVLQEAVCKAAGEVAKKFSS